MFTLYILYTLSYFLHFGSRISGLGAGRVDLLLAVILIALMLMFRLHRIIGEDAPRLNRALLLLLVYVVITIPFVYWPGSVVRTLSLGFPRAILFFFFTIAFVNTEKRLMILILIFTGCQLFRAIEPTVLHLTTGYWGSAAHAAVGANLERLSGAPHDVVNPNQLAWIIVLTVPFLYYFGWRKGMLRRSLTLGLMPVLLYALLLTGSRSGLLSLFILIFALAYYSGKRKVAMVTATVLVIPLLFFALTTLSPALQDRYFSIVGEESAHRVTIQGRWDGLINNLETVFHRPFFGHGLGTSLETNANIGRSIHPQITHNLYIEVMQELGIIGFLVFAYFIYSIFKSLNQLREFGKKLAGVTSLYLNLANACLAWMVMHLFYSMACFGLNSWEWYFFGGVAAVSTQLAQKRLCDLEGESSPLRSQI